MHITSICKQSINRGSQTSAVFYLIGIYIVNKEEVEKAGDKSGTSIQCDIVN